MTEKLLGADAAAVETAGSIAPDAATARHTPGPWDADVGNWGKSDYYALVRTGAYRGDSVDGLVIDCEMSGENKEQDQANAHLIAAAPEMKAELQITDPLCLALATVAMRAEVKPYLPYGLLEQVREWLATSRGQAVLAKSEGRERQPVSTTEIGSVPSAAQKNTHD